MFDPRLVYLFAALIFLGIAVLPLSRGTIAIAYAVAAILLIYGYVNIYGDD